MKRHYCHWILLWTPGCANLVNYRWSLSSSHSWAFRIGRIAAHFKPIPAKDRLFKFGMAGALKPWTSFDHRSASKLPSTMSSLLIMPSFRDESEGSKFDQWAWYWVEKVSCIDPVRGRSMEERKKMAPKRQVKCGARVAHRAIKRTRTIAGEDLPNALIEIDNDFPPETIRIPGQHVCKQEEFSLLSMSTNLKVLPDLCNLPQFVSSL